MAKTNILKEAIEDSKQLKKAALDSAKAMLLEGMKEKMKEFVENHLNEEDEVCLDTGEGDDEVSLEVVDEPGLDEVKEEDTVMENEEFELEDLGDESDEGEDEGLSDEDLDEALRLALQEVEHGDLGEPDEIDVDTHDTGILDVDTKEAGWEEKTAPAAKDWTVKEHAYKGKVASLAKEVVLLRKANAKLTEAMNEVNLFNRKLFYASRVMQKEGLTKEAKMGIVKVLDSAKSAQQVKGLYESFETVLGVVSKGGTDRKISKTPALAEALGSSKQKAVSETVLSEGLDASVIARNKKLAGI